MQLSASRAQGLQPALLLLFLGVSSLAGYLLGTGNYLLFAPVLALVASAMLLLRPLLAMWAVIIGATVITGLVDLYAPAFKQVAWLFALLSAFLMITASIARVTSEAPPATVRSTAPYWAFAFAVGAVTGTLINEGISASAVAGIKGYLQAWGVLAAMCWLIKTPEQLRRIGWFLAIVALIQLPFALHQFLVLVPLRTNVADQARGIVAIDIVAGTFGGDMKGGGRSMDMAVMCSVGLAWMLTRYRQGLATARRTALLGLLILAPLALSEVKAFAVFLPLTIGIVYADKVRSNPIQFFVGALFAVAASVLLLYIYSFLVPSGYSRGGSSFYSYIDMFSSDRALKEGYGMTKLNRITVYPFWFERNILTGEWLRALFGYGAAASNPTSAIAFDTLAATTYKGMGIGNTGVSSLLWDLGIVGALPLVMMILATLRLGARLNTLVAPEDLPLLKVGQVGAALLGITVLLGSSITYELQYQVLTIIFVGIIFKLAAFQGGQPPRTQPA